MKHSDVEQEFRGGEYNTSEPKGFCIRYLPVLTPCAKYLGQTFASGVIIRHPHEKPACLPAHLPVCIDGSVSATHLCKYAALHEGR